jgi:aspartyl-tRNA(Asn)/glutamyl-tRNA(Gln) amidotransferase subunit B
MWTTGRSAQEIVDAEGLAQIGDEAALQALVAEVLARHPDALAQIRAGRTNLLGFLVGQVMKATQGKANPRLVSDLIKARLG